MSGAGRKHRAKHLCQTHNSDDYSLSDGEQIVRLLETRGNHYHVEDEEGGKYFARLPARFNKVIWMKRGDLLVIVKENEEEEGVCGVITHRLSEKQVKRLLKDGLLPKSMQDTSTPTPVHDPSNLEEEEEEEEEEDDPWLRGNPNVAPTFDEAEEEEEEEEED